ncbi:MAG: helix-hairpin-helix domain-containing protein, partial [Candidatus Hydrogenedentes bacterium]|nr:helix-hairpin-helix domain-containing protein [Candidatus Hydrogenedentota bacterium]
LQYDGEAPVIPAEVLIPIELEDGVALSEILAEKRGGRVVVHWPQRGEKRALIDLAMRNAKSSFDEKRLTEQVQRDVLVQLRGALKLRKEPNRIECFDISTIQGTSSVGSMVTFEGGAPNKARYRRYSIKNVAGQDDFAMMREMLMRRFKRAIEEQDLPDLVLIDGGKGQLNVAVTVFKDLGIEDLDCVGVAKSRALEDGGHSPERFFLPGMKDAIVLPQNSPVVLLIARVRDEAHRFAITYHRKRRTRAALTSPLTGIPGIGAKRARQLLNALGSMSQLRAASREQIAAVPGFTPKLAETIKRYLESTEGNNHRA